jgi:hypothetical protein
MSQERNAAVPAPTRATGSAPAPVEIRASWSPCPACWGQRRILEPVDAPNGEGRILVAHACDTCLGLGEVLRSR